MHWIDNNFSMNIHESVLQKIAAFIYCNCQAAAGSSRRQTKVGNFHVPAGTCETKLRPWAEFR